MRWACYLLVVLNAMFFSWQMTLEGAPATSGDAPARAPELPAPGYVNRLLLVSELESGILRERVSSPIPVPAPAGEASGEDPGGGDTLAALGERGTAASPAAAASLCYSVGPLADAAVIEAIGAWLGETGADASLRVDERREVARYWVYLPPAQSREEADARVESMRAVGIDDIYVIPRGDMAFAISLGLFSQRDSLDRRLAVLERRGFTPSVSPRYRSVTASWYDVSAPAGGDLDGDAFAARFPEVEVKPVACPGA